MNYKQYIFVILLLLWTVLVGLARIRLGCHKKHQIFIGFFLGILWGYLLYIVIESIKKSVPRIAEDEEKISRIFEV